MSSYAVAYPRYDYLRNLSLSRTQGYNITQITSTIVSLFKHPDSGIHEQEILALITYHWVFVDGNDINVNPYGGVYHFSDVGKYFRVTFDNLPPELSRIICEYILSQVPSS